jgi:hypothetical protein
MIIEFFSILMILFSFCIGIYGVYLARRNNEYYNKMIVTILEEIKTSKMIEITILEEIKNGIDRLQTIREANNPSRKNSGTLGHGRKAPGPEADQFTFSEETADVADAGKFA